MINEEQYLKSRLGDRNPFRVPDGYFDRLSAEVMQRIPEQPRQGMLVRMRPLMYAAACLVAVIFSATVYLMHSTDADYQQVASMTASTQDSYIDDAADYVMADNIDIYACLASDY